MVGTEVDPPTLIGGGFQDSSGAPLANGTLTMQLTTDISIANAFGQGPAHIAAGVVSVLDLDDNGNLVGTPEAYSNNLAVPSDSFYRVKAYSAEGQLAWGPHYVTVTGNGGEFDVGTWVPQ